MARKPARIARKAQTAPVAGSPRARVDAWFAAHGWTPWQFQRDAWNAYAEGKSGLIQVPTGSGKTYAAFLGPLMRLMEESTTSPLDASRLRVLYVTPLRAVTRDIELALRKPIDEMQLPFRVESRTGDTSSATRARQRTRMPDVLVTTPESLALLLTRDDAKDLFASLQCAIVDEWHDLLVSKRGTLLELCMSRVREFAPDVRTWGMSATLPNSDEALRTLTGVREKHAVTVRGDMTRDINVRAIIPDDLARLPWAGHLGLNMLPDVLRELSLDTPTIVFVNTRSQSERWFAAITFHKPEWTSRMALHHGSLDREERERVEAGLKTGDIRIVVATSSLDLGVDFSPIEKVIQIGSPKGVARVIQRAGRASHRPNAECEIACVPTHHLELVEIASARRSIAAGEVEPRYAMAAPLDVLAQHLVTCALGGGFREDAMYEQVRTAWSYRDLSRTEFDWAMQLVCEGGVLHAYPQFRRITRCEDGVCRVLSKRIAQMHRMNVGTIVADGTLDIVYNTGRKLGTIDENFITNLRSGQRFVFAGKTLQFIEIRDCVVYVRPASGSVATTPIWAGTKLPISESLAAGMRDALEQLRIGVPDDAPAELIAARQLATTQLRFSRIPLHDELLVETTTSREGSHLFVFPFEGRLVHAGLAAILALRLARRRSGSFSISVNDYGLEVLSADSYPFRELFHTDLFSREGLADDAAASVNMSQLAKVAFREIARVSGLVLQNVPGAKKTGKHVQASSTLIFDVLTQFDPSNMLLEQARREVLDRHFEGSRLGRCMARLQTSKLVFAETTRFTPLSFPLVVEREATKLSTEGVLERLRKMREQWGVA
ncbi:MAG TPA: ligase-associated DNA damage response DEXH box helicase [Phycisphaerales bacterium]|nr:ligase-associated DNA damage response DEXH box helicase [Phycisphaerales bacterium]